MDRTKVMDHMIKWLSESSSISKRLKREKKMLVDESRFDTEDEYVFKMHEFDTDDNCYVNAKSKK